MELGDKLVDDVGAELLRSASELLAAHGPSALTVRRIAQRAGVSTMNVYSRFGSKLGVIERLYIDGFTTLREHMHVEQSDDALADLSACGEGYRRFALEHPTSYAIMFDDTIPDFVPSDEARVHAIGTLAALVELVERVIDEDRDPWHVAATIWASCHGVICLEVKRLGPPHIDWETVYRDTCAALVAGLVGTAPR